MVYFETDKIATMKRVMLTIGKRWDRVQIFFDDTRMYMLQFDSATVALVHAEFDASKFITYRRGPNPEREECVCVMMAQLNDAWRFAGKHTRMTFDTNSMDDRVVIQFDTPNDPNAGKNIVRVKTCVWNMDNYDNPTFTFDCEISIGSKTMYDMVYNMSSYNTIKLETDGSYFTVKGSGITELDVEQHLGNSTAPAAEGAAPRKILSHAVNCKYMQQFVSPYQLAPEMMIRLAQEIVQVEYKTEFGSLSFLICPAEEGNEEMQEAPAAEAME